MNILVIAPHPDDEIIGVGGTIAKRCSQGHNVFVCVVTKGCEPLFTPESVEIVKAECERADSFLGVKETIFWEYPAAMLDTIPRHVLNGRMTELIREIKPHEVYIPNQGDMHIDHKIVSEAAMVALRPRYGHLVNYIYAYETLSETGWDIPNVQNTFIPTVYENISDYLNKKNDAMAYFQSQLSPFPAARSIGAINALAKYRGSTVSFEAAEAFSLIRGISE